MNYFYNMQAMLTVADDKTLPARIAHIGILWQILQNIKRLLVNAHTFLE